MNDHQLHALGMEKLTMTEMQTIEGGKVVDWLKVIGAAIALAVAIISAVNS